MRTVKKGLAILLALVMVLSLTACGSLSAAKAIRNMLKADSYHVDCTVDMNLGLGMMEQNFMNLDLSMGGTADVNHDPFRGTGKFQMEMLDEAVDGSYFFTRDGDELIIYTSTDGENWNMSTIELQDFPDRSSLSFSKESLAAFAKIAELFEETGTEIVNGSEATVYSGTITGEELQAMMDDSGQSADLPEELDLSTLGAVPVTVAVDNETGMVSKITVDLAALTESLLPLFLQLGMQAAADDAEEPGEIDETIALLSMMDISCNEFLITVLISDYNEVGEVTIPDEVIASAEAALPENAD